MLDERWIHDLKKKLCATVFELQAKLKKLYCFKFWYVQKYVTYEKKFYTKKLQFHVNFRA